LGTCTEDGVEDLENPDELDGQFDASQSYFMIMIADVKNKCYRGCDNLTYVKADTLSSSRLGEDDITPDASTGATGDPAANCLSAPSKINKTKTNSFSASLGLGGSWSSSETETVLDVVDFNGDRYPDIISVDNIQYTKANGGLNADFVDHGLENHKSESQAISVSIGGNFASAKSDNTQEANKGGYSKSANAKANANNGSTNSNSSSKTAGASFSANGNLGCNGDATTNSWMDMNGDGLPDKVYKDGRVALNIGYSFLPDEQWGFTNIRQGSSIDAGAGLGVSLFNGSIQAGIGANLSQNSTIQALQDVNGDGLNDIVTLECDGLNTLIDNALGVNFGDLGFIDDITTCIDQTADIVADLPCDVLVKINTGNGFEQEISWPGYSEIDKGTSTGESANASFTVCFPIPFIGIKVCVNPNASVGRGVSRQTGSCKVNSPP